MALERDKEQPRELSWTATCVTGLLLLWASTVWACTAERSPEELVFNHGKLAGDPQMMRSMLDRFEAQHPGVRVREEVMPASTDQQHQYYAINLDSPNVPFDLFAIDVIWAQEFARAGWIQDVHDVLPSEERSLYFASALEAASYAGRLHAIPWYLDVGLLFYRKDLLERYGRPVPTTWPELVETARLIVREERNPSLHGFLWTGKQYEGLMCVALELMWARGGSLLDPDDRAAEEAVAFLRDLIQVDALSPPSVGNADEEAVRLLFNDGRAVFMRNWPYAWLLFEQEGSPLRGKVGMAALPRFEGHRSTSVLGGWMLAVPTHAAHRKLALELLRYLAGYEAQAQMARLAGYHPARRDLYAAEEVVQAQPWLPGLYSVFLAAQPRPPSPFYLMLTQVWQPELSAAIVGAKPVDQAFADARRGSARILGLERTLDAPVEPKETARAAP